MLGLWKDRLVSLDVATGETRLVAHVFYTFTRLAADHTDPKYDKMRRQVCCSNTCSNTCCCYYHRKSQGSTGAC